MDDAAFAAVAPNYAAWARKELDAAGGVLFAFGHTHRPYAEQLPDGRVIMNCGSWVPPALPTVGRVDGTRVELLEVAA
jgi:UDP-2,3-diacylglucosamine pyrophosphatase LpxH